MGGIRIAAEILQHRDEILRLAAKHKAGRVRLIGSFARGEARPDSDVDFLVPRCRRRLRHGEQLTAWTVDRLTGEG